MKKLKIVIEVIPPNSSWRMAEAVIQEIEKSFKDNEKNEITIEVKSVSYSN